MKHHCKTNGRRSVFDVTNWNALSKLRLKRDVDTDNVARAINELCEARKLCRRRCADEKVGVSDVCLYTLDQVAYALRVCLSQFPEARDFEAFVERSLVNSAVPAS